ncbi:MAG: hypothetical protein V4548_14265 [Bacteroidota bacterium]
MGEKEFIIKRGITDNHRRRLIFNERFLKFENKDLLNNQFTKFQKDQITDYSFGVKWMRYYFVFGREYIITIKNAQNQIIKINFKTYFGRKKKEYNKLYSEIITGLWECYFEQLASNFIKKNEAGEEFEIGEVLFTEEGIIIKTNSSIRQKKAFIPWEKIRTRNYATYFAIYAVDDAASTNRGYSYLNDWNTDVLYSVIRTILSKKNIETYK